MNAQSNESRWIGEKSPSTADMEAIANSAYEALPSRLREQVERVCRSCATHGCLDCDCA